jgi:hypothetical protein
MSGFVVLGINAMPRNKNTFIERRNISVRLEVCTYVGARAITEKHA